MNDALHTNTEYASSLHKQIEHIIHMEWSQFQRTHNEGGRASCQGNWPMFERMRLSQFSTWPANLLADYARDLEEAERVGRNLITEKYARMMESTHPEEYQRSIQPFLQPLSSIRIEQQERIITQQVVWARDFMHHWPHLGAQMRVLTTEQDTTEFTSFETYLRGELSTYSQITLNRYEQFIQELVHKNQNLTERIVKVTAYLTGFTSLDEAECAQQ